MDILFFLQPINGLYIPYSLELVTEDFSHIMPHCVDCGKGQTKLNEKKYCKACYKNHENDTDGEFWNKMDKLFNEIE